MHHRRRFGVVAAENVFERTGGLSAWARGYSGKDANLRNSFVDNEARERQRDRQHSSSSPTRN